MSRWALDTLCPSMDLVSVPTMVKGLYTSAILWSRLLVIGATAAIQWPLTFACTSLLYLLARLSCSHWKTFLRKWHNLPENIDEHWATSQSGFIWCGWSCRLRLKRMLQDLTDWESGRQSVKAAKIQCASLEFRSHEKVREHYVNHQKRNATILLVWEAETAANTNDSATIKYVTKEITDGHKSIDGVVRHFDGILLIHDNRQLKRKREHLTLILNYWGSSIPFGW